MYRRDEKSRHTKGYCSFPLHMLNYPWGSKGIHLIFTMETNTIQQYMHTHWGSNCHGIQRRGDQKVSTTRPIYLAANWTLSQPSVYHSLFHSLPSSLLPFSPFFLQWISFVISHKIYLFFSSRQGLAVLSKSRSQSSGDRGKKRSSAGIPRDARRCSWTGTARTHPPPLLPPVRAAAAVANRKGRGENIKKSRRGGCSISSRNITS